MLPVYINDQMRFRCSHWTLRMCAFNKLKEKTEIKDTVCGFVFLVALNEAHAHLLFED